MAIEPTLVSPHDDDSEVERVSDDEAPQDLMTPDGLQQRISSMRGKQEQVPEPGISHALALVVSMGFSVAGAILGSVWVGHHLDNWLGTTFCLPLMLVVGLVVAALMLYKMLKPFMK